MTPNLQKLRYTYLLLYTLGGVCTLMTLALLIWVAVCIALEAEPLAAISFLSHLPTPLRFVIITCRRPCASSSSSPSWPFPSPPGSTAPNTTSSTKQP